MAYSVLVHDGVDVQGNNASEKSRIFLAFIFKRQTNN